MKYNYGHCLYIFDLGERAKGVQMMTLSHAQFKDLDERKFKLWSKAASSSLVRGSGSDSLSMENRYSVLAPLRRFSISTG